MSGSHAKVFVYGTLKKGGQYHHLLMDAGATYLGEGILKLPYPLILAQYPCLLDQPNQGHRVSGEVYSLPNPDSWEVLDHLEGHPDEYTRRLEPVHLNGKTLEAWTYFYQLPDTLDPNLKPVACFKT